MLLLEQHQRIMITELQHLIKETAGNLDYHIKQLEKEDLVAKKPGLFNKRVYKMVEITKKGHLKIISDIETLKEFLDDFNIKKGRNE